MGFFMKHRKKEMKKIFLGIALIAFYTVACKVKSTKENANTSNAKTIENANSNPIKVEENKAVVQEAMNIENKTLGKVSHRYRATGCNTVIEVKLEGEGEIQTLIPKDKLAKEIDVDGKEIYFNFLLLRMPQPQGCNVGQPADITDIVSK
jgi:hypothetical protein